MSDLLKVRIGGSSYLCKWEEPNQVVIAGGIYKFTKIGNLLWTTRNFAERISGIEVIYPNNNSVNEEKYGLLYKAYDVFNRIIPILPDGWRVPTESDFSALGTGGRLWRTLGATDEGGYNEFGFNANRNGWRSSSGNYSGFDSDVALWTSTPADSTSTKTAEGSFDRAIGVYDIGGGSVTYQANTAEAIRFCKDVS